jgi:hypothetical protein
MKLTALSRKEKFKELLGYFQAGRDCLGEK